ncbi:MAG: 1-deoxy-D-xylulose-5-phosphate synthase, partial [Clostridia bacterium]|nr:1-deoxy-D-xylulose-5-phosphate synthase [Clostridia bacterium]
VNGPVLLHVQTVKGKGCPFAEANPRAFHGVSGFNAQTGEVYPAGESFSDRFGLLMREQANKQTNLCAITAAMGFSTGLEPFKDANPDRFFDVGIAEEHAVTFAAGLAKDGMLPVFAVYSTFLQRCYDELVHDVALQKTKVIFAIDRAGFVGEDGETHQGLMDVPFLCSIPNLKLYSPCCFRSLQADLNQAINADRTPVAVHYPRGGEPESARKLRFEQIEFARCGDETAETLLVTYGRLSAEAADACDALRQAGIPVQVLALNQIRPLPEEALALMQQAKHVFFFEEGLRSGGVGEQTALRLLEAGFGGSYHLTAVPDVFVAQATVAEQLRRFGLDAESMAALVKRETEKKQ